ncbi:MAG: hypothetical protein A2583_09755 [Bdellovibrionales bacterium RIFOXYD1_FULL_53_11]|nr:MAG: hypothetical protein A2583_09755 [Bdellovibrionales bacterium RIFOXYD1_FULL_53_11]
MRALVTGASGFVGSTLAKELVSRGIEVVALMRRTSGASNLEDIKYTRAEGSLFDRDSLARAMTDVDLVFHAAGVTTALDESGFMLNNADGTRNVAEAAAHAGARLKRVVYISSLAAGGPSSRAAPRTETDGDAPVSAYGRSKLQGEVELLKHKDRYGVAIIRPPIVYGPRDKAVFSLIKMLAHGLMPLMRGSSGDGKKYYSTIHASDLARMIADAGITAQIPSGEVFYACSNNATSYEQILDAAAHALGTRPLKFTIPMPLVTAAAYALSAVAKITRKPGALGVDKLNEFRPDCWTCSNGKARSALGFRPAFEIGNGMHDTIAWYRKKGWLK